MYDSIVVIAVFKPSVCMACFLMPKIDSLQASQNFEDQVFKPSQVFSNFKVHVLKPLQGLSNLTEHVFEPLQSLNNLQNQSGWDERKQ